MTLLGPTTRKNENFRLVGASLPTEIHSYLTLHATAKSTTKSAIIKKLISSWMDEQKKKVKDDELINAIVSRVEAQWKTRKAVLPMLSVRRFKDEVKEELLRKGLESHIIDVIISRITT